MFVEHFAAYGGKPEAFSPIPATWGSLCADVLAVLAERGDKALMAEWPVLSASDYLEFSRTGNRTLFEEKYFARRHLLNDLVMAECARDGGRYIAAIADGLWSVCEESGWQLPAHNNYIRDTPRLPLPDVSRPVLDLFACETAALLALSLHLLGDRLSPHIAERLLFELKNRIIIPYLNEHFWWMGTGDEPMCNWTSWCTKNVLLVAALMPLTDEFNHERHEICGKAVVSLDCFLKDYGEDGCCDEGAMYYGHAALALFSATEVLNGMTGGHFAPLYKTDKIRNMADFIRHMNVAGDYYINFADCPAVLEIQAELVYLFGKRTGNEALSDFAAEKFRGGPSSDLSLYNRLVSLFIADEILCREKHKKGQKRADIYFPSVGILIARDERMCLAVKAGDNDDNHNHNDAGSFMVYIDGKPFIIDAGVGSYTKDTFSERRYDIWTMQSAYHNLLTFNGVMQKAGADYGAADVYCSIGDDETIISMDISGAYPKEAGIKKYTRNVFLKKGVCVSVTDVYEGKYPAVLSLMLCSKPVVEGASVIVPGKGQIKPWMPDSIDAEHIPITDPKLQKVWGDSLYRVLIKFPGWAELEILPWDEGM